MPNTTDPANARLALRRLLRNLIESRNDTARDADTFDAVLAHLDTEEIADYEQVVEALRVLTPPRFARHGHEIIDLRQVYDPHGNDVAVSYLFDAAEQGTAAAVVRLLNSDPDAWDRFVAAAGEEPF